MTVSEALTDALSLERTEAGYGVELDESWVFDGRIFGGYVVALAAMASSREVDHSLLRSAQTVFAGQVEPGEITFEVVPLRRGRNASPVHVVGRQAGEVVASTHFWFVRPSLQQRSDEGRRGAPVPPPLECPALSWLPQLVPFLRFFEERAIDYPLSLEEFHDGKPFADLWARLDPPEPDTVPLLSQIFDVMLLDAHLIDGVARREGLTISGASLDLSVHWLETGGVDGWTRIRADAELTGSLAATSATLYSETGTPRAGASSQLMILRR